MEYIPYLSPLLIAFLVSVSLLIHTWRHRQTLRATIFMLMAAAVAEWLLGYILELGSFGLSSKVFWGKVQYLGIVATPLTWFAFALQFSDQEKWLTRRNLILAGIVPLLTLLLIWTTELHGLMWNQVRLDESGPFPALRVEYGPWFWVHSLFSYALLLTGTVLLVKKMLLQTAQLYRWQTVIVLLGVVIPWIGNGAYLFGLTPIPNLDLTPFAFTISIVAFAWGLFRFHLLDIVPVARRTAVDMMSDGVIVLDVQNRVVDINPAAQRAIGKSAAEVIGQTGRQVFGNWPELVTRFRDVPAAQEEIDLGEAWAHRYFDLRVSPLYGRRGELEGRLIVLRDITERKRAEEALAQARDRALEASRLKSELLAKVSHELRTPLGVILGYTELLQEGVFDPISERQHEALAEVISSAEYLTGLVDELLDQAQFETGNVRLNPGAFGLQEMVDQIAAQMNMLAGAKGLNLRVDIDPAVPAQVWGDQHRLQQIVVNLVSNAVKFTKTGTVRLHIFCPDPAHWAIQVADTGPGIPPEAQMAIFEPFRQVDGSLTREHGGAGLGLSIVKQLALLHGGEVSLESEVGRGSTFTVRLPLRPVREEAE